MLLTDAVKPHASDVISEAWFYVGSKMLASKSRHFLSHFQSENGNKYSRWPVMEVLPTCIPHYTHTMNNIIAQINDNNEDYDD